MYKSATLDTLRLTQDISIAFSMCSVGAQSQINIFDVPDDFEPLSEDFQEWDKGADLPSGVH